MINTSLLTSLSVKNENSLQSLHTINKDETSIISNNNNSINALLPGQKIIIYNIEFYFLIPATIIFKQNLITFNNKSESSITDINNSIILSFYEYEHKKLFGNEVEINIDDIYYETTNSFDLKDNCINLETINELTLLRNIYMHLKYERKAYLYLGNIFIALKHPHNTNVFNVKRDYEMNEFIKENTITNNKDNIIAMYYGSSIQNKNDDYEINCFYGNVISSYATYSLYNDEMYIIIMYIKYILFQLNVIRFIMVFDNNNINNIMRWIPIFPTGSTYNNFLYTTSIFFPQYENTIKLSNTLSHIINEIKQEHFDYSFYNANIKNKEFIDKIYSLCISYMKNSHLFKLIIKLFRNAYLEFTNHNIFTSNMLIILMYFNIIEYINIFIYQTNITFSNNNVGKLILIFNICCDEDDSLLTESIKQELFKQQTFTDKHNSPLSRFLWFYFETQITSYMNKISKHKTHFNINNIITTFPSKTENSNILSLNNKIKGSNNIINYNYLCVDIVCLYNKAIKNVFNDIKLSNTKQIWFLQEISPIRVFENEFINNQKEIPNFYNMTHLIEYCNEYKLLLDKGVYNIRKGNEIYLYKYRDKIIKVQARIRGNSVRELLNELKKKVIVIQKVYRCYIYRKVCNMDVELLIEEALLKWGRVDMMIQFIVKVHKEINILRNEKERLNNKIKNEMKSEHDIKEDVVKKCESDNVNIKEDLIKELEKINEKNNKLIHKGEMYIKQMNDIINIVNNNKEIQNVLQKNGFIFK